MARKQPFKRYLSCGDCGREIVATKGAWRCPHCDFDNRPIARGFAESRYETEVADANVFEIESIKRKRS